MKVLNVKNSLFFFLIVFYLIFGVLFYDAMAFNYIDESLILLLLLLTILFIRNNQILAPTPKILDLYLLLLIYLFYLFYSLVIKSNVTTAIVQDSITQIKPYLAFYCTMIIYPKISTKSKRYLRLISIVGVLFILVVSILGLKYINLIFVESSRLATAITIFSVMFYYSSKANFKTALLFILFLSVGFFSLKAKFYGFYVVALFIVLLYRHFVLKMAFKSLLPFFIIITVIIILTFTRINFFFIQGANVKEELFARPALYEGAWKLLSFENPFGTGFGSFATFYSGVYYSPIYKNLGLNYIHGLTKGDTRFVSDAFFPSLAQVGIVGICLFICFWTKIISKANKYKAVFSNMIIKEYTLVMLLVFLVLIESFTDSTFTQNRGAFIMIILAVCLTDLERKYRYKISHRNKTGFSNNKYNELTIRK